MDREEFEHRRASGFPTARRGGYAVDEVDRFLAAVSEWLRTGAARELGDELVRSELEQVGTTTARMLMVAEHEAAELEAQARAAAEASAARTLEAAERRCEELLRATEDECARRRAETDTLANETCSRAEQYATRTRAQADDDARRVVDDAAVQARAAFEEERERLRAEADAVVTDLDRRRDAAVQEVERLRADLLGAIAPHAAPGAAERDGRTGRRRQAPTYGPSEYAEA